MFCDLKLFTSGTYWYSSYRTLHFPLESFAGVVVRADEFLVKGDHNDEVVSVEKSEARHHPDIETQVPVSLRQLPARDFEL